MWNSRNENRQWCKKHFLTLIKSGMVRLFLIFGILFLGSLSTYIQSKIEIKIQIIKINYRNYLDKTKITLQNLSGKNLIVFYLNF